MVFNLDYERRSDLDDSVGYWYVQPRGDNVCRVYYSCDSKLRQWVPGPVYNVLTKQALKQATSWVNDESLKEWAKEKVRREREAGNGKNGIGVAFDGDLPALNDGPGALAGELGELPEIPEH